MPKQFWASRRKIRFEASSKPACVCLCVHLLRRKIFLFDSAIGAGSICESSPPPFLFPQHVNKAPLVRDAASVLQWFGNKRLQQPQGNGSDHAYSNGLQSNPQRIEDKISGDTLVSLRSPKYSKPMLLAHEGEARTQGRLRFFRTARRISNGARKGFGSSDSWHSDILCGQGVETFA